jgi:DNA-binding CsgD family transcriptional regulator
MTRRLRLVGEASRSRADGAILHANESFRAMARRRDGIEVQNNTIDFAAADARTRLRAALDVACRLLDGDPRLAGHDDFLVPRSGDAPAYVVSVRVLGRDDKISARAAVAIVFVRDPLSHRIVAGGLLRAVFGFTDAEQNLAQAVLAGTSLADYARTNAVTLNTVYTHLRRIKDKTGCSRMAELIRKLNDLQVPLRPE